MPGKRTECKDMRSRERKSEGIKERVKITEGGKTKEGRDFKREEDRIRGYEMEKEEEGRDKGEGKRIEGEEIQGMKRDGEESKRRKRMNTKGD